MVQVGGLKGIITRFGRRGTIKRKSGARNGMSGQEER